MNAQKIEQAEKWLLENKCPFGYGRFATDEGCKSMEEMADWYASVPADLREAVALLHPAADRLTDSSFMASVNACRLESGFRQLKEDIQKKRVG